MSDTMRVQPFDRLLNWILTEFEHRQSIFGLPRALFFTPAEDSPLVTPELFGQVLGTPIGPAAGPHTQLSQNIISAWLSGGRFIELKTVQIMDELEIPRPCIDVAPTGEGYNVEWSQELKLDQSAREYVNAWALIHILHRLLGFEGRVPLGTIFNMSVGYNLAGIQSAPMVRFMDRMEDASADLDAIRAVLSDRFPQFAGITLPTRIANSVTLSTMHGCPPDEIEHIARHLLRDRHLHTIVKLNPTLLGRDTVRRILHDDLGFGELRIPDAAFEHDLQFDRAVQLITSLKQVAASEGLFFGVKLSNTLAMANHRAVLPGDEMYMSGRALYPLTVNLFHRLIEEFDGDLNVSYAGGADAFNVPDLLAAGALPVTAASDLLKPGGYSRLRDWLDKLEAAMRERGARSLVEWAGDRRAVLARAAGSALSDRLYKRSYTPFGLPQVQAGLAPFDCIAAPCVEGCAVCQDVPEYCRLIAHDDDDRALEVILRRNPLPGVTGYVCTHLCQSRCTRNNYDQPVTIRDLKRFAFEHGRAPLPARPPVSPERRVAVVGSGPAGLAAAYFLALSGVRVTVLEAREMPGGMLAIAPHFRLPPAVVQADIDRIAGLGVDIALNNRVTVPPQELLAQGFDAVYLACGFQHDAALKIEGIDGQGVFTAIRFLEMVARGQRTDSKELHLKEPELGERVLVIGGGNTAMDAARTAQRLTGRPATIVYRRSQAEMPAEPQELRDLFDEGNTLIELASPRRVILRDGRVAGLECVRNELGEPDADGRRMPIAIPGSEFQIEASAVILAVGQQPDLAFLAGSGLETRRSGALVTDSERRQTSATRVYAGGDVTRDPAIIIQACADGRRAAEAICAELGLPFELPWAQPPGGCGLSPDDVLRVKEARARKAAAAEPDLLPVSARAGFDLVEQTLSEQAARREAARCLQCAALCDKCVEVCPNRANYAYSTAPGCWAMPRLLCTDGRLLIAGHEDFTVEQPRQILHIDDFCNACGNCATFCVHPGRPYADKPRLFLNRADFEREADNAFYLEGTTLWRRDAGREARLIPDGDHFLFEDADVCIRLSPELKIVDGTLKRAFDDIRSLKPAAELALLFRGIVGSMPFLLS